MFLVLKLLYEEIKKADKNFYRDERISNWPLLGSPWPMVTILVFYLLFVKLWGPKWLMRDRKPYNVKNLMQAYNVMQILLNIYIFYGSFRYSYFQRDFKLSCQEYNNKDFRNSNMNLRFFAFLYYISKYLDLLDTIFFVLRKKYNQISFLHVYHHSIMIYGVWVYCTLLFASHYTMTGVINSFIHVCMYAYYFVAALQLDIDLTPWKRRLTQLQIVQFCYLTIHFIQPIVNNWCGLDMFWVWVTFVQNLFMLALFCDFYYKTYYMSKKKINEKKQHSSSAEKHEKNTMLAGAGTITSHTNCSKEQ